MDNLLQNLFIYDVANNHQGDVEHALNIIRGIGEVSRKAGVKAALKFQFRQLETLVHPSHREKSANKHIPRFLSTKLGLEDFRVLADEVRRQGMLTMATPFDEASLKWIEELDIKIIKIASCSGGDRPLLQAVSKLRRPTVASTGGLTLGQIDYLVSLLADDTAPFALMHCVAIYPTPNDKLRLNQITLLRQRYPSIPVGWSTHEDPNDLTTIQVAYAKGASLFERHVGLNTDKHKLNTYSSTPAQIEAWLGAYQKAVAACGGDQRAPGFPEEMESLRSLSRGVFARRALKKGEALELGDIYFAMPCEEGQLTSGQFHPGVTADRDYAADEGLSARFVKPEAGSRQLIFNILLQTKGLLNNARIFIGKNSTIDISHHYGLERFREYGCIIVNCINRSYCKKLIIVMPRQKHPYHFHKKKEETFQLLHGDLEVEIDGVRRALELGETVLVEPGKWHKFHSLDGAIFEEVSTTHYNNDSFYEDDRIALFPREQRKTELPNWEAVLKEAALEK